MLGTKYYKYNETDKLELFRLIRETKEEVTLKPVKGRNVTVSREDLNSKYVRLKPDALLRIAITTAKVNGNDLKDVYVLVYREDNKVPTMAIRQNTLSRSKNFLLSDGKCQYVGDCNIDEREMSRFIDFDTVDAGESMVLYVDDTVDSILKVIGFYSKTVNPVLEEIYKCRPFETFKGYSLTLKDLLIDNNFMMNYRSIFNIMQVDFIVDRGDVCRDDEGNIHLTAKDHAAIEAILCQYIDIGIIIKYDKDIDISGIVNQQHCMISDKNGVIYLMTYVTIAPYKPDNDINEAFKK